MNQLDSSLKTAFISEENCMYIVGIICRNFQGKCTHVCNRATCKTRYTVESDLYLFGGTHTDSCDKPKEMSNVCI